MPRQYLYQPCIPTRRAKVPAGPDWLHEIKHDGYLATEATTKSPARWGRGFGEDVPSWVTALRDNNTTSSAVDVTGAVHFPAFGGSEITNSKDCKRRRIVAAMNVEVNCQRLLDQALFGAFKVEKLGLQLGLTGSALLTGDLFAGLCRHKR